MAGPPGGMGGLEDLMSMLGGASAGGGGGLDKIWENPMVANIAFHPSTVEAEYLDKTSGPIRDGTFDVSGGDKVSYRFYMPSDAASVKIVVFFFHGNAEVCTNMDPLADVFHCHGAALLSIDYRGYAWGTGQPSLTKLCDDAVACFKSSELILENAGVAGAKRVMHGRSIGATCAVHLAANFDDKVHGLIVDSGLMSIKELPTVQMLAPMLFGQNPGMFAALKEPFDTLGKLAAVSCPTLVMHGDMDEIVPFPQAEKCHQGIATAQKKLQRWAGATHNDVGVRYAKEWANEIFELLDLAVNFICEFPAGTSVEAHSLSSEEFNGSRGTVVGRQGERIRVNFAEKGCEKALKPANLKVAPRILL